MGERNDMIELPKLPPVDRYGAHPDGNYSAESMRSYAREAIAATIARLSEALAEAEKKGAEVRELPWERRAFGGLWTAKTSLGSYFIDANEEPCEWAFGRQDYRAAGSLEEAKAAAQADYEARVRACLAPPRDLSQGSQHG